MVILIQVGIIIMRPRTTTSAGLPVAPPLGASSVFATQVIFLKYTQFRLPLIRALVE